MKTKRLHIMILLVMSFFGTLPAWASPSAENCGASLSIVDPEDLPGAPVAIEAAFADYSPYYDATDDVYYLNIAGDEALGDDALEMDRNFELTITANETKDIYLCNLNLTPNIASETPFLSIVNSSDVTVHIYNMAFTGIENGLSITNSESDGIFEIYSASITGGANKSGPCLTAAAEGAIVDGGTFTSCAIGVNVKADNVTIQNNASIYDNKTGVEITADRLGTKITHSLVYGNAVDPASPTREDGIRVGSWDLSLYDVVTNEDGEASAVELDDEVATPSGDTAYMVLPQAPSLDGHVELYLSNDSCDGPILPYFQACGYSDMPDITINQATLSSERIISYEIPPSAQNENFVAVYVNDVLGSTAISQTFIFMDSVANPVIAFVRSPFDILTPGDAPAEEPQAENNTEDDDGNDNNSSSGTQMSDGGGGNTVESLPVEGFSSTSGCKGQIFAGDEGFKGRVMGLGFWWVIFSTALLAGVRTLCMQSAVPNKFFYTALPAHSRSSRTTQYAPVAQSRAPCLKEFL